MGVKIGNFNITFIGISGNPFLLNRFFNIRNKALMIFGSDYVYYFLGDVDSGD